LQDEIGTDKTCPTSDEDRVFHIVEVLWITRRDRSPAPDASEPSIVNKKDGIPRPLLEHSVSALERKFSEQLRGWSYYAVFRCAVGVAVVSRPSGSRARYPRQLPAHHFETRPLDLGSDLRTHRSILGMESWGNQIAGVSHAAPD
jgi:hypothetical protein